MKKLLFLVSVVFMFTHCDKTPPRVPPSPPECVLNTPIVNTNTATSNSRKVLLEDYTGHTCGQCPPAATEAEEIYAKHNGKVIVIANHVSETFGAPKKNYNEEFRDPASTAWDVEFGMSGPGLPCGTVNRVGSPSKRLAYSAWESVVESELEKPQTVKLDVTTTYDPIQKLLEIKVLTTFKTALSFDVNLLMVITQDSIIGPQTNYSVSQGKTSNYRWDHIMVKAINGTWGQSLKAAPIRANDSISIVKNCYTPTKVFMNDAWPYSNPQTTNDDHLNVVVFAYNAETKEVLQVERLPIKKAAKE